MEYLQNYGAAAKKQESAIVVTHISIYFEYLLPLYIIAIQFIAGHGKFTMVVGCAEQYLSETNLTPIYQPISMNRILIAALRRDHHLGGRQFKITQHIILVGITPEI